ncbi:hypothetical protein [Thalassotalea ganghwensis]
MFINTGVSPYDKNVEDLLKIKQSFHLSRGSVGEFAEVYKTQLNEQGIIIVAASMPYLPIYILPFDNIDSVIFNPKNQSDYYLNGVSGVIELKLSSGDFVALSFNDEALSVLRERFS